MKISIGEARDKLTALVRDADKQEIIVTRHGEPMVVLVPYREYEKLMRVRAYLDLEQVAHDLQGSGLQASDIYQRSRQELERRTGQGEDDD